MRKSSIYLCLTVLLLGLGCLLTPAKAGEKVLHAYGFENDGDFAAAGWSVSNTSGLNSGEFGVYGGAAQTGTYGFRFSSYSKSGENTQYLISPEFNAPDGLIVSFAYKASSTSGTEKFKVGYSTTDNQVESFTFGDEISTNNTAWQTYLDTLPGEAKYVAIYYYANYQYRLFVDDFTFSTPFEGASFAVADGETTIATGYSYDFGLATEGTEKAFTLTNNGTVDITLNIAATNGFGVSPESVTIAAGNSETLTVSMAAATATGVVTITPTAEGVDAFSINVAGTVRDASKCFASFTDGSQPADWTTSGSWSWTNNYAYSISWYASSNGRLISPLLIVADGEKFVFEAALNYSSTYNCLTVEYSANGTDWTASETVLNVTSDAWQWFEVSDIPAGAYYIALHACRINIRNFYGGTLPAVPSNVQVSNLTDAGVTITWDASGSETAWQVNLVGGGDNKFINVNDIPSLGLTNLEPNTTYTVKVRVEDGLAWTEEVSFKTLCGAEVAPVQWSFGDDNTDAVPDCWDNSGSTSTTAAGSSSYYVWGVYYYSGLGENMLRMYNTMVQGGTALINTPRVILPTATQELTFDYSHRASCGDFTVKISTDNGANWTDLQAFSATESTSTTPGEFVEATISLAGYEGETVMLQFFAEADYDKGAIFIDNISIQTANACAAPKSVTASNITNNSAVLAWTEKGEATKWNIQLSENGSEWYDAATGVEANPYKLTGLNPTAVYSARVQAVCGTTSESNWSDASATFTTLCDPVEEFPIVETFESSASPNNCWSVDATWKRYEYTAHTGGASMRFTSSADGSLTMQPITLNDASVFTFYQQSSNLGCYVTVKELGGETLLDTTITRATSWKQETIDLSAFTGKTVLISIRGYKTSSNYYLYVDDIEVNYKPVAAPTNVQVTVTSGASVQLTWDCEENAEGTQWYVEYRPVTEPESAWQNYAVVNEKTSSVGGLDEGVLYEARVRTYINDNRVSEYSESVQFTPESCPAMSTISFGDETYNSIVVNWEGTSEADAWELQYQQGELGWSATIEVAAKTYTLTNLETNVEYKVRVKPACGAETAWLESEAFTLQYTAPTNVSFGEIRDYIAYASWDIVADADKYAGVAVARGQSEINWNKANYTTSNEGVAVNLANLADLAPNTEYDYYLAAVYGDDHLEISGPFAFTTVTIAPENVLVDENSLTTSFAQLSWDYDGHAPLFEWALRSGDEDLTWNEEFINLVEFDALTANTAYTFYVRAKYDNGVTSDSVFVSFRTLCDKFALPFEENFNTLTASGEIPSCWNNDEGTTTANYKWSYNANGYDGACVRFESYNNSKDNTNVLATPVITLDKDAILKFWCKNPKGGAFEVLIAEFGAAERDTLFKDLTGITAWTEKEADLSAYTGKDVVLYFCGTSNWGSGDAYLYLDDITITEKPACSTPKNLTVSNVLYNQATITWTAGDAETKWVLAYYSPETDSWSTSSVIEDEPTFTIPGLTNNVEYAVRVKAYCDAEHQSDWTDIVTFTPAYIAPTNIEVSDLTSTSAHVVWDINSGEDIWSVEYREADGEWQVENVDNNWINLSGLNAATNYEIRITAGDKTSETVTFMTNCAHVTSLPWKETFESTTTGTIPTCWDNSASTATNSYEAVWGVYNYNSNMLRMNNYYTKAGDAVINSPIIELPAESAYELSFEYANHSTGGDLFVNISTDGGATWQELGIYPKGEGTSYTDPGELTEVRLELDAFAGESIMIQFAAEANYDNGAIFVDNVTVREPVTCEKPTALEVNDITDSSASLTWTSDAENFALQTSNDGDVWSDAIPVAATDLPYALEGLDANTLVFVRVQAICGEGNESEWTDAVSFQTLCAAEEMPFSDGFDAGVPECWVTEGTWATEEYIVHDGNSLMFNARGNAGKLTTPAIHITEEDAVLVFYLRNSYNGGSYVAGQVSILAEGETNPTLVDFIQANSDNLNRQQVNLSEFYGKNVRISFVIPSVSSSSTVKVYIDDVRVVPMPCGVPTNLVGDANENTATLTWSASEEEETMWQVRIREFGGEWEQVDSIFTAPTYTATELQYETTYEAEVRAYCDETHQGEWSSTASFVTGAEPTTGVDNINVNETAVKYIENDQVVIRRNGRKYNAQGQRLE